MNIEGVRRGASLLEAGEDFALVTTLETKGSSPRHSGAWMIVEKEGLTLGTVGGGPLEARAIQSALEVLDARASRLLDYELTDADAAGLGMICGGTGVLLIEHVDPTVGAQQELYRVLLDLLAVGGTGWLVTRATQAVGDQVTIERCLVDSAGNVIGSPVCSMEALQGLARAGGALDAPAAAECAGVYVQPIGVSGTAYVFGAGHCGQSLVPLLGMVGFHTVIVDDRAEFANPERFPDADSVLVPQSFENALEGLAIDEQSYLVIMTRGHVFDRILLAQALRTGARYIGMIGSKKKIARIFETLRAEGFQDEDLARVHAPIGLAIGAETPEEIAVSIAAEIIQERHSRSSPSRSGSHLPPPAA